MSMANADTHNITQITNKMCLIFIVNNNKFILFVIIKNKMEQNDYYILITSTDVYNYNKQIK